MGCRALIEVWSMPERMNSRRDQFQGSLYIHWFNSMELTEAIDKAFDNFVSDQAIFGVVHELINHTEKSVGDKYGNVYPLPKRIRKEDKASYSPENGEAGVFRLLCGFDYWCLERWDNLKGTWFIFHHTDFRKNERIAK